MKAGKMVIIKGRVIDPKNGIDEIRDVWVESGKIIDTPENSDDDISAYAEKNGIEVVNAEGYWVTPGLIDLHTHLREPGFEHKETIATGTKSAVNGGFTTVCCMPNTNPVVDNEILVEYIKMKAEREGFANVLPIGAITKGQAGDELSNIGNMAKSGIVALSEDGKTVKSAALLKTAMKYAGMFGLPVFSHCEDTSLAGRGLINAGETAAFLGLAGISNDSEEVIVARDIILAESVKAKLHICHVSTEGSIRQIEGAQKRGVNVTAESTPHHFTLTDADIKDYDANFKMSPPLRRKEDVESIKEALKRGVISVIATDHAPHHIDEKNCEFENAANGIVGLETALPLSITELVKTGILTPMECIAKLTANPAEILGLSDKIGHLGVGADADITIIDPDTEYVIDKTSFMSKSVNTSFDGRKVTGMAVCTIVNGKVIKPLHGELLQEKQ